MLSGQEVFSDNHHARVFRLIGVAGRSFGTPDGIFAVTRIVILLETLQHEAIGYRATIAHAFADANILTSAIN